MIFGHEGLPGSGKSLEAMTHVVSALERGRKIVTNVAGIDHRAIADYVGLPISTVEDLLICIEPPETMNEDEKVAYVKAIFLDNQHNDCLWIWDEINQFWPPDRQALPAEWAKFVTEHRHLGMDILVMGQDLAELHTTWRRRLQRYTRFTKLDMQNKDDSYHWSSLTNIGRGRFKQTQSGKRPYNKDFFGFYKSHEEGTENKSNYKDSRFSVFSKGHKIMAFFFGILLIAAVYQLFSFFSVPKKAEKQEIEEPAEVVIEKPKESVTVTKTVVLDENKFVEKPKPKPIDYLDEKAQKYELRLAGVIDRIDAKTGQSAFEFVIDFLDPAYRVKERMGRKDIVSLGWSVHRKDYGLLLTKQGKEIIVRAWPLDNFGKVPQKMITDIKSI